MSLFPVILSHRRDGGLIIAASEKLSVFWTSPFPLCFSHGYAAALCRVASSWDYCFKFITGETDTKKKKKVILSLTTPERRQMLGCCHGDEEYFVKTVGQGDR